MQNLTEVCKSFFENRDTGVQTGKRVGGSTKKQEKKLEHSGIDLDYEHDDQLQHKS